jgi:NADH-quinone oxidoreductase subunit J
MSSLQPFLATGAAALGLLLILLPGRATLRYTGAAIGMGALAWLLVLAGELPGGQWGASLAFEAAFIVFAAVSVASAVAMISQQRPIYAALFFVLVVLSTCGLLLLLEAFFIAFAVVIVYAGAILITYMFVLMLAHQASDAAHVDETPAYDRHPREPVTAVIVSTLFVLSGVTVIFTSLDDMGAPATGQDRLEASADLLNNLPRRRRGIVEAAGHGSLEANQRTMYVSGDEVVFSADGVEVVVAARDLPGSTRQVGWDLVTRFPASLEVAGVVLLLAMFGAVVLARRQIELSEESLRASAGLPPLSPEEHEEPQA